METATHTESLLAVWSILLVQPEQLWLSCRNRKKGRNIRVELTGKEKKNDTNFQSVGGLNSSYVGDVFYFVYSLFGSVMSQ